MIFRTLNAIGFALILLIVPVLATAMELTLVIEPGGSCISPDRRTNTMRRSESGEPIGIPLSEAGSTASTFFYYIPRSSPSPGEFTLRFRLDDIPLEEQYRFDSRAIYINGAGLVSVDPTIVDYKLGTGDGDFVEFTAAVQGIYLGTLGSAYYYSVHGGMFMFLNPWRAYFAISFIEPYVIDDYRQPDGYGALIDRWFQLKRRKFPDSIVDGGPFPEYISLDWEPVPGGTVEISGDNLIYDPSSAVSDGNGVFGVAAFVKPDSFDFKPSKTLAPARTEREKADARQSGQLNMTYEETIRSRKIDGFYCEAIMVEGTVRIVGGSGTVKVGDILYPGMKLSLAASYGSNAQLGLRFINGSDAQIIQDVFTNACVTDLIVIGKTDFSNHSVIQGKTPLMSASRYLCEKITGMPNTPEKWARATGRFVVTTAASMAVPGSGVAAYVIRYGVETAAGKAYDYMLSSPGDNRRKSLYGLYDVTTLGNERVELICYHDGSTRIIENIPGSMALYDPLSDTPFAVTSDGQWLEITDAATIGRTWDETPDTIDQEGPSLRMTFEHYPAVWIMRFELRAFDLSGIDPSSLSVTMAGLGNVTDSFEQTSPGVWVGEFIGAVPPSGYQLSVSLSDKVGNTSLMNWLGSEIPSIPRLLSVTPAYFHGGTTKMKWEEPVGMTLEDVLFYEVRQWWRTFSGWQSGQWQSVGVVNEVALPLPEALTITSPYFVEIRAWNRSGVAGAVLRTEELYPLQKLVDQDDLLQLILDFRSRAGDSDYNQDGVVNYLDVLEFTTLWNH